MKKSKSSVLLVPERCGKDPDRNAENKIIIVGGAPVLASLNREYNWKYGEWKNQCASVHARFKKKTSRSQKNGKEYEYTNWYEETAAGLKSVGKEEPDYSEYYPPEPKPAVTFKAAEYNGHLILEHKDYEANSKLFKDCLIFSLEDCKNLLHPLYKNPEKALKDSVRSPGVSSGTISDHGMTEKDDNCRSDGDCGECEYQDECPVIAEDR